MTCDILHVNPIFHCSPFIFASMQLSLKLSSIIVCHSVCADGPALICILNPSQNLQLAVKINRPNEARAVLAGTIGHFSDLSYCSATTKT